jgi:signal peptidase I
MKRLAWLLVVAACGGRATTPSTPPPPAAETPPLLHKVGAKPRGYASVGLAQRWVRTQLVEMARELATGLGKSLADCNIDLDKLERVRVAIGEPLRVAAELDGKIDVAAVACMTGEEALGALANAGFELRDRPGGIAIEYNATREQTGVGADVAAHCTGRDCVTVRVGPASQPVWVSASFARALRLRLEGHRVGAAGAALRAAVAELRATVPALAMMKLDVRGDALTIEGTDDSDERLALALREHLLEAFKIPSSAMEPTLHIGDHIFAVKGPLAKQRTPGDIYVYRTDEGRDYIFRYLTGGPHTVTESDAGIAIDGAPLRREVIDAGATYLDMDDYPTERWYERSGSIVREHLGARSYRTFRMRPPSGTGPWKVPAGTMFMVGDNRNNANDSRYNPPVPLDRFRGRAVVIWWAARDGVPDWDRIGTLLE